MMSNRNRPYNDSGLHAALTGAWPILLGYLPAAVAFGVAARRAGLSATETTLMSILVYAGASQVALVGLFSTGASPLVATATALLLNLRHVFYGVALAPRLRHWSGRFLALAGFGLTDEVFAVVMGRLAGMPGTLRRAPLAALELIAYGSWVGGTWLGAAGGEVLHHSLSGRTTAALDVALPALFVALLAGMLQRPPARAAALVAGVVATAGGLGGWGPWSLLAAIAAGAAAGLAWDRRGEAASAAPEGTGPP